MHEQSVQYQACLQVTHSADAQQTQAKILELQEIAFHARYGDVFGEICSLIRTEAETLKVPGWQSLCNQYWAEISDTLRLETPSWEAVLMGKPEHASCPTHMAISKACRSLGFDVKEVVTMICLYATRNKIVHADLEGLIKEGKFNDLAKRLHDDYCDVPKAFINELEAFILSKALKQIIDKWFVRHKVDPDNYQLWTPTAELSQMYMDLSTAAVTGSKDPLIYKAMIKVITNDVAKILKAEKEAKILSGEIAAEFGITGAKKTHKRVSSTELEAERKKSQKMGEDWTKLTKMAGNARKFSDTYKLNYGELQPPPDLIEDPSL